MGLKIDCDCGIAVRGDTEDELVVNAQEHARRYHGMTVTREQALALAEPD